MTEQIANLLIALIPSVVGIIGIVASVLTCVNKVKDLTNTSENEVKMLKEKLTQTISNNIELSKVNEEFKTKINELEAKIIADCENSQKEIEEIIKQNLSLIEQNAELKNMANDFNHIKQQLTQLLKKGK